MQRLSDIPTLEVAGLEAMLSATMSGPTRADFDGTHDVDYAYDLSLGDRFRVNALRDRNGPAAVFRRIPPRVVTADELNLAPSIRALCALRKGLVLVTGPTGSGKSTTLCAMVDLINQTRTDHIITIEDPIEFLHESAGCVVTQREVGEHTHSFRAALRAALREDPDVILVGEMRDLETVTIALETAETGHLVLATLHTTTAASAVDRVIDQFPPEQQEQIRVMLATSLRAVIAQVLCRRIDGGRVAAREVLLTTPSVSNLIRQRKAFQLQSVMQTSKALGMVTLNDALMGLVERGEIDVSEAMSHTLDRGIMQTLLETKGYEVPPDADVGAEQASGYPPRLERAELSHTRELGG